MSFTTIFTIFFCVSVGILTLLEVVWGIQIINKKAEQLEKKNQGSDDCELKH